MNSCLFIIYFKTLSAPHDIILHTPLVGWLVNNEFERMRKEAIVLYFDIES
jgi:hypothetical protein